MVDTGKKEDLNERERSVLRHVVYNYILTAIPVGSRILSKRIEEQWSPATIRNVMADLEEVGYLSHPHTSAGRVPTDLGYRYYVDYLMEVEALSKQEKQSIETLIDQAIGQDELFRESSRLLGKISKQLSVVASPHLSSGVFEKLELIPLSSSRLLVVISIRTGLVKTVMLEVKAEIHRDTLLRINQLLNERLSGLTLQQIRDTFAARLKDMKSEESGLVRLFIESVDVLFDDTKERERVHISGTQNIIEQPEFIDPKNFRSVIELVENENVIVHLLEKHQASDKDFVITIGTENNEDIAKEYSMVTTSYSVDGVSGRLGIIGPKRMNYSKVVPLIDHVAKTIAKMLKGH
ncbi:MAG: heat-inducible transcriptional repressor HrcA [Ignavibacteriae bacterium]|nr:heat-inducible transcriptional repressor HrcA [Ignavibacteriota bacterium]